MGVLHPCPLRSVNGLRLAAPAPSLADQGTAATRGAASPQSPPSARMSPTVAVYWTVRTCSAWRRLRSRHIGPAGQHGARHARGNDGQGGVTRSSGQGKAAGHLAHQHGQRVGQQRLLALQGQGFGLGGGHFGLHAGHVQLGHITSLLAALRQAQGVLGYAEQAVVICRAALDDAVFRTLWLLVPPIWAVRGALRPDYRPYGRTCPSKRPRAR